MKKAMIAALAVMTMAPAAQAAVRTPDVYTDGAHVAEALQRSQAGRLADEQFRRIAVRKTDPFVDGALRQVDPFTDGALARLGTADPFSDGA
ncbi:hypothetical protein D9M68_615600 [compost metagenome]